eukprot:TRINITY_DN994_c0_g1_i1.p2 TRINITY_DN994_c0_g1~~TRINITY_DN994_c0_g1_i1.p2  ORF type:complete len:224 (-),score=66.39 TRINITY_DN994_c0_g1_i1:340-1011(-)
MGRDATEQDVFPRREEYDRPRAKRKIKEPERFEIDPHLDDDIMRAIRLSLQQQQSSSSDPQPGGGGSKAGIEPKRLRVERQTSGGGGGDAKPRAKEHHAPKRGGKAPGDAPKHHPHPKPQHHSHKQAPQHHHREHAMRQDAKPKPPPPPPPPAEPELPPPRAWWFERLLLRRHDCGALGCGEGEGASTDDDWHRRVWSRQRPYLTLQGPLTAEDISAGHEAPA